MHSSRECSRSIQCGGCVRGSVGHGVNQVMGPSWFHVKIALVSGAGFFTDA